jgi:hypothetical protein
MGGKKGGSDLATNIRFGTRVRHISDGVLGRIVWANAVSVKIEWDDGEKVTWKRAELGIKGVAVIDEDDAAKTPAAGAMPESDRATMPADEAVTTPASAEAQAEVAGAEATAPAPQPATSESTAEGTPAQKRRARSEKTQTTGEKKPSALDAAARVLAEEHRPMGCQEMIGAMAIKGYWTSPGGKTPAATLYSAILREIDTKGDASRFVKVGKGQFARRPQA